MRAEAILCTITFLLSLLFREAAGLDAPDPLVYLYTDELQQAYFSYTTVDGATLYTAHIFDGNSQGIGSSSNAPDPTNIFVIKFSVYNSAGGCYLATFSYTKVVTSAQSDAVYFCVPGATSRRAGGGGQGNHVAGFADGYNDNALFNDPFGFAFTSTNDMIICDRGNNALRQISYDGVVSTIPIDNTTFTRISTVAINPNTQAIYVVDEPTRNIIQYISGTTTVVATLPCGSSSTGEVISIVNDWTDNFYIASGVCATVYTFDSTTNSVQVLISGSGTADGGQGSAGFLFPCALAYDVIWGNLYIADSPRNAQAAIRVLDPYAVSVTTLSGFLGAPLGAYNDGPKNNGTLGVISSIALNPNANDVMCVDVYNNIIRAVGGDGSIASYLGRFPNSTEPCPSINFQSLAPSFLAYDPTMNAMLVFSSAYYNAFFVDYYVTASAVTAVSFANVGYTDVTITITDSDPLYLEYDIFLDPGNIQVSTSRKTDVVISGLTPNTLYSVMVRSRSFYTITSPKNSSFTTVAPVCNNGQVEPGEDCDGGTCCDSVTCLFKPSSFVCRTAAGPCDIAESCSGSSDSCPTDQTQSSTFVCDTAAGPCEIDAQCGSSTSACPAKSFQPSTFECRPSAGDCDPAEKCTGSTASCPTDSLTPSGTSCRASVDLCDREETCDGTSPVCPPDLMEPSGTVCRSDVDLCDASETCDGSSSACPADSYQPSGFVCRPAADTCDANETCSGTTTSCPSDSYQPSGFVCRAAVDICDTDETCSGSSTTCPTDSFQPATFECRPSAGDCDVHEMCSGSSATCPSDSFQPSTQVCRTAVDICDVDETCTGTSATCPLDIFQPSTLVCRVAVDVCDANETCSGSSASCPSDSFQPSTLVCRVAIDDCDTDEKCSGSSATCPTDLFQPSTQVCRPAVDDCDEDEKCSGSSATCPSDTFKPNTVVCRVAVDDCDANETCTGSSASCPPDVFQPSTFVCRSAIDICDADETCSGSSSTCPPDSFQPSTLVCRASIDDCDANETCTGSSATCPPDLFEPSTTVCRIAVGDCDANETCTGSSASCPGDTFQPSTLVCRVAVDDCDVNETCTGSSASCPSDSFAPSTQVCRPSMGICDSIETCTGTTTTCPADSVLPTTQVCRNAADVCDVAETCDGINPVCPTDNVLPSTQVCRIASDVCDAAETCDGTNVACPADSMLPSTHVCRNSSGTCDTEETCDGINTACPVDTVLPSTHVCRNAVDVCDIVETCDGINAACPVDSVLTSAHVCRNASDICDAEETCDGMNAACPVDSVLPNTQVCRSAAGVCDAAETCDGINTACPVDIMKPSTQVCRNAVDVCDATETCDGTNAACPVDSVLPSTHVCRNAADVCDAAETCDGINTACPADSVFPSTQVCRNASGLCDVAETCDGINTGCPVDGVSGSGTTCRSSAGPCDIAEVCDGINANCPVDAFLASSVVCNSTLSGACDKVDYCDGISATCADVFLGQGTVCRAAIGLCYTDPICDGSTSACPSINIPVTCINNGTCDVSSGACGCFNGNPYPYCNAPVNCSASNTCDCPTGQYGPSCVNCTCVNGACADGRLGDGSCSCASGWTGTLCDVHVAPVILSARFANNGLSVYVYFDIPTNQSGQVLCSSYFSPSTLSKFGTKATCAWDNAMTLTISFNNGDPVLLPGYTLSLLSGVVASAFPSSLTASGNVNVLAPTNPDPVSIAIQGPSTIGSCNSFSLSAQLLGTANRNVLVTWVLQTNGADNVTYYNSVIQQLYTSPSTNSASTLSAPANFLTPGNAYLVQVSVTNYLGTIGSTTWSIARASLPTPTVTIDGPASLSILTTTPVTLKGSISSCISNSSSTVWLWTIKEIGNGNVSLIIPGLDYSTSTVSIPQYALVAGKTYILNLSGSYRSNPTLVGSAEVTVTVDVRPIVAKILGGSSMTQPANSSLVLDASSSYDPDYQGNNPNLRFSWSVVVLHGPAASFIITSNNATLVISPPLMSINATYTFTVVVSDGARSSSASINVHVIPAGAPVVAIQWINSQPFRASQKLVLEGSVVGGYADNTSFAYLWSESSNQLSLSSDIVLTSRTSPNLVLAQNALKDGLTYKFLLQITTSTGIGYAQLSVSSAPLPSPGIFLVSPSTGAALSTLFTLQCNGWQSFDGSSLHYSFSYIINGQETPIGTDSFSSSITSTLPSSNTPKNALTLVARVSDAYTGTTVVTTQVTVVGATQGSANSTLNDVLASYNASAPGTDVHILPGLVASTYELQAIGGSLTANQTSSILSIAHDYSSSITDTQTAVQLSQLLSSVSAISPESVASSVFIDTLTQVATSNKNSNDSRLSVINAISHVYDSAISYTNNATWFDSNYSSKISDILDLVFLSASDEMVCGENSSIFSKNVKMEVGRDYQQFLEGATIAIQDSGALFGSVLIPPNLFTSISDAPSCVGTQYIIRPQEVFSYAQNYSSTRVVSNIDSFAMWNTSAVIPVSDAPLIKINLPLSNYTVPECLPNSTTCEYVYCAFWNTLNNTWDVTGVSVVAQTRASIVCQSTHLTDFALIVGLKHFGSEIGATLDTFGKVQGNPYAIIFVSGIYACYALAIFTVWLVDAKQDIEQMPMLEKKPSAKKGHAKVQPMEHTASYNQLAKQNKQENAPPTPQHMSLGDFVAKVIRRLQKQHTWLSVYYRARHDSFNRIRRMTVVLSLVMCMLAISSLYLLSATKSTDKYVRGSTVVEIAFLSSILAILPNSLILLFFYKAKARYVDEVLDISKDEFDDEEEKETPKHEEERVGGKKTHGEGKKKEEAKEKKRVWLLQVLREKWPWWWGSVAYVLATFLILSCGYTTVIYGTQFAHAQLRAWFLICFAAIVLDAFVTQVCAAILCVCVRMLFKHAT